MMKFNQTEVERFFETPAYKQVIRDVSLRLGVDGLDANTIENMFVMCQMEQSWQLEANNAYAWCSVFTPDELRVFDYGEDLFYYNTKSHGFYMNEHLMCLTIVDMLDYLVSKHSGPKVVTYFVHSTNLYLVLTALGVLRDSEPLRGDNFDQMNDRLFKSSEIMPFSSNFAAVKYECTNKDAVGNHSKILFLLNQRPIRSLRWCPNGFCDWTMIKKKLRQFTPNVCKRNFCARRSAALKLAAVSVGLWIFAITVLMWSFSQ